jgi:hypothetical protein
MSKHDPVYERLLSVLNPPCVTKLYEETWLGDRCGDELDRVSVKLLKVRGWDADGYEYTLRWVESNVTTLVGGWNQSKELVDKRSDSEAIRFVQKLFSRLIEAHPAQQWQVGAFVVVDEPEDDEEYSQYKGEVGRVVAVDQDEDDEVMVHLYFVPNQTLVLPRWEAKIRFRIVTQEELLATPLAALAHEAWQKRALFH